VNFIDWSDDYELGDELIDAHHRVFFEMVRDLVNLDQRGPHRLDVSEVLRFLTSYIAMHFLAEEQLMERLGYTDIQEHRRIHRAFTEQVSRLVRELEEDPAAHGLEELLALSQQWFLEHILQEDMKIGPAIRGSGA